MLTSHRGGPYEHQSDSREGGVGRLVTSRIGSPTQGFRLGIDGRGPKILYFVIHSECLEQVPSPTHDVITNTVMMTMMLLLPFGE